MGRDESGPGADAIKENLELIPQMHHLLWKVLKSQDGAVIYGYSRNPANIMLDVSILAISDQNKPLMAGFIELATIAIETRPENKRLVVFSLQTLGQLLFEPECNVALEHFAERILKILRELIPLWSGNKELANLRMMMGKDPPPVPNVSEWEMVTSIEEMARLSMVIRSTLEERLVGCSFVSDPRSTRAVKDKCVAVSFHTDSKPIATRLANELTNTQLNVIIVSESDVLKQVDTVVVLVSRKYKESANCRKECELAKSLDKTLIFVSMEQDYQPEGWLALVMGKSTPIACWDEEIFSTTVSQVRKELGV